MCIIWIIISDGKGMASGFAPVMAKKKVAGITTVYTRHAHADVLLTKILEGYNLDGGAGPNLEIVGVYVDQFPANDMSRELAKKHGFRIFDSIADAVTLGTGRLAVDGVLCIGEHGKYPTNAKGQILYPRRRFFEEVCKVFAATGRSVPVFNDKHLAATWDDARWMYDRARELFIPFMAGSSVPVTWRRPPLKLPMGCDLLDAVQIGYGPFEGYGFHALEGLQCMVERRRGGEVGVQAVRCVQGDEIWKLMDQGVWSKALWEAAAQRVPAHAMGDYRALVAKTKDAGLFLIEYLDGFKAAVILPNGWVHEGDGGSFCFAGRLRGTEAPLSTQFYLQQPDPFAHFAYLLRVIDSLIHTGHAPYPVERTLLTTGILDAGMTSRAAGGTRIQTPHLAIRYRPTDWPFATDPVPMSIKR